MHRLSVVELEILYWRGFYLKKKALSFFQKLTSQIFSESLLFLHPTIIRFAKQMYELPARWRGVELRPWVSRQFMLSGVSSRCTLARLPFLAASSSAALPLNRSATSWSPSLTSSKGVAPSRFFLFASAPCWNIHILFFTNFQRLLRWI